MKGLIECNRRGFLEGGLAFAVACALPLRATAGTQLTLRPLRGRISLIEGGAANIVVAASGTELVLVDGGSQADARSLQRLLQQHYPGQRLRAVFNTHWHHAQTGFNAAARAGGVDVIAHENTRLWLTTEVNSRWENRIYEPVAKEALPNRTFFYDPQQLDFDGGAIEYVHLDPGHTDGDIYVRFPDENVIVAGDVLSPGRYPIIDTASNGYLGGINAALKIFGNLSDTQTRLVPAVGPVCDTAWAQQQLEMGEFVLARMSDNYREGGTFEEFVAAGPTSRFDAEFGDPSRFLQLAYDSAWYQVSTMGGLPGQRRPPGRGQ